MQVLVDMPFVYLELHFADLAVLVLGDRSSEIFFGGLVNAGLRLLLVKTASVFVLVLPEAFDLGLIAENGEILYIYELLEEDWVGPELFHLVGEVELQFLLVVGIVVATDWLHLEEV